MWVMISPMGEKERFCLIRVLQIFRADGAGECARESRLAGGAQEKFIHGWAGISSLVSHGFGLRKARFSHPVAGGSENAGNVYGAALVSF